MRDAAPDATVVQKRTLATAGNGEWVLHAVLLPRAPPGSDEEDPSDGDAVAFSRDEWDLATPLALACRGGHHEAVKVLLDGGAGLAHPGRLQQLDGEELGRGAHASHTEAGEVGEAPLRLSLIHI